MGLFGKSETCAICNENDGVTKFADGVVCKECFRKCAPYLPPMGGFKKISISIAKGAIEQSRINMERQQNFNTTRKIGTYLEIDEGNKWLLIPDGMLGGKKNPKIYSFSEIVEYELLEDDESITKGGLGSAIVGGAVMGGVGAIVGGVTGKRKTKKVVNKMQIKITLNNLSMPPVYITLINTATKSSSMIYKAAQDSANQILSALSVVDKIGKEDAVRQAVPEQGAVSAADEILKFKQLLDSGIISQEEFDGKKKELLGL